MNNKKDELILVTGGTGFVGSYLIRYLLQQGYTRIRALCRASSKFDLLAGVKDKIEWVEADILDIFQLEEAMEGVQKVYHCAAIISFDPREHEKMLRTNRDGTANVVNTCLYQGVKKLVHVSSIAAIGRDSKDPKVDENTKWQAGKDNATYAISKFQAEQEVWRGQAEGLTVAVVNPSVILGAGFWDGGTQVVFKITWDDYPFYPVGSSGFVDVRDVARFLILLMESEIKGERYLLNGSNKAYRAVQSDIAKAFDRPAPRYALSPGLAKWAARLDWLRSKVLGKEPLLTKESAHLTSLSFTYINDKSLQDFDFYYTPLAQTIEETATLFKEAAQDDFGPRTLQLN